ncbi:MAG: Rieske 2Fe-2S domain-containing protein [Betaproteobacteria bacterium]
MDAGATGTINGGYALNWQQHPDRPADGTPLCRIDDIPDQNGREVCFGAGKENFKVLLLRQGEQVWTYVNFCPHFSLPLNYEPQTFVTLDGLIMCAHHTAFFNFNDGRCVDGPCIGDGLVALPSYVQDDLVYFGSSSTVTG